jgi:hypothetical protein
MKKRLILLLIPILLWARESKAQDLNFVLTTDSVVYDTTLWGAKFSIGYLQNLSLIDTLTVDVIRIQNNLFGSWETGICTDICYPTSFDSVSLVLSPGQIQVLKLGFRMYIHNSDTAHAILSISNRINPTNTFIQNYYGIDSTSFLSTSILEDYSNKLLTIYPNPLTSGTTLKILNLKLKSATLTVYNSNGQEIKRITDLSGDDMMLSKNSLSNGLYLLRFTQDNSIYWTKLLVAD